MLLAGAVQRAAFINDALYNAHLRRRQRSQLVGQNQKGFVSALSVLLIKINNTLGGQNRGVYWSIEGASISYELEKPASRRYTDGRFPYNLRVILEVEACIAPRINGNIAGKKAQGIDVNPFFTSPWQNDRPHR